MSIYIPAGTNIGKGLVIFHGYALVINRNATIGSDVILTHCTTIGEKGMGDLSCPVIGDRVNIGPHVSIIGNVHIGDDAIIGAGSVVISDVPEGAVVGGNPARILR